MVELSQVLKRWNPLAVMLRALALIGLLAPVLMEAQSTASEPSSQTADPFAWLEDIKGERALAWVQKSNERTLKQLTQDPRYQRYHNMALAITQDKSRIPAATFFDGWLYDGWVYNLWQDDAHPRGLWRRARLASYEEPSPEWELLLDMDALAKAEGKSWQFRTVEFLPPNGHRCMIALSDGGKDTTVWREFDIESRSLVKNGFVLPEAVSLVVWKDGDTLLVSTDSGSGAVPSVKRWSRGQVPSAAEEIHRGQVGAVAVLPEALTDGPGERILVIRELGPQGTTTSWMLNAEGGLLRLALPPRLHSLTLHRNEWVFSLLADWAANGRTWKAGSLLSMPVAQCTRSSPTVRLIMAPGPRESIVRADGMRDGVLVISYSNVRGRLLRFIFESGRWRRQQVPLPDSGTINFVMSDLGAGRAFIRYESFLQSTTLYEVDVAANRATPVKRLPAQFDASRYTTEQFEATSSDGTKVPYFVVRPKAFKATGQAPTLMHGYGYIGFSQFSNYSGFLGRLWLEQGGVYVLANIRGGSEFGPGWHVVKTQRHLVYDDFIAVAEDLIRRKITSPRHLGIEGMSAGGLLMGVMLTQRPDLFHAAVVQVPVLDQLNENLLGGHSRFIKEFGSPDILEERAFLERTSPYQNLTKRVDFPVPFFMTSTNDDRVHPGHVRKFAAKMEAFGMPFLYYESPEGGHDMWSTPEDRAMHEALIYTYLVQQLME